MGTDNRANLLLSSGEGAPGRMRHCIRRFKVFVQRIEAGECKLEHVPDAKNGTTSPCAMRRARASRGGVWCL